MPTQLVLFEQDDAIASRAQAIEQPEAGNATAKNEDIRFNSTHSEEVYSS
jgi:hypothetical protein